MGRVMTDKLTVMEIATGKRRFQIKGLPTVQLAYGPMGMGTAPAVAFSPDGRMLAASGDPQTSRLWDMETAQEVRSFKGSSGFVGAVALSRDGKYALTAVSAGDSTSKENAMHLWEVATGQELRRYPKHPSRVERVTFSPDGRHILAAYEGGPILVWETAIKPAKP